jgi:hypothetical protein
VVTLPTFLLPLEIRQQAPMMVEAVAGKHEPWVLLGRCVLHRQRILPDGPRLTLGIG